LITSKSSFSLLTGVRVRNTLMRPTPPVFFLGLWFSFSFRRHHFFPFALVADPFHHDEKPPCPPTHFILSTSFLPFFFFFFFEFLLLFSSFSFHCSGNFPPPPAFLFTFSPPFLQFWYALPRLPSDRGGLRGPTFFPDDNSDFPPPPKLHPFRELAFFSSPKFGT